MAVGLHASVGNADQTTGGMTWMTGTYDPDLNLIYWGTGNPTPVLNGTTRPGDDLYTCSIVALNPDTGKLAWAFQPSPHDTHDWDAVETPVLVDGDFHGEPHKMLMQSFAQRLLLRSRPHQRKESADRSVRSGELVARSRQARPSDSESREGTGARWSADRARRRRPDQLPLAQLRPEDRFVHRRCAPQLEHLFRQAGRRSLRLGRRGLRRLGQGGDRGHRLPDRQDPLEP